MCNCLQGESFDFKSPVTVEGPVESWMTNVEREMRSTLQRISKEGVYYYAHMPRAKWIEKNLGMVTLSGSAIWWTWQTEDVFQRVRDGNQNAMKVIMISLLRWALKVSANPQSKYHHRLHILTASLCRKR